MLSWYYALFAGKSKCGLESKWCLWKTKVALLGQLRAFPALLVVMQELRLQQGALFTAKLVPVAALRWRCPPHSLSPLVGVWPGRAAVFVTV